MLPDLSKIGKISPNLQKKFFPFVVTKNFTGNFGSASLDLSDVFNITFNAKTIRLKRVLVTSKVFVIATGISELGFNVQHRLNMFAPNTIKGSEIANFSTGGISSQIYLPEGFRDVDIEMDIRDLPGVDLFIWESSFRLNNAVLGKTAEAQLTLIGEYSF